MRITLALGLIGPASALADMVTYTFSGTITSLDPGVLESTLGPVGTPISLSYALNPVPYYGPITTAAGSTWNLSGSTLSITTHVRRLSGTLLVVESTFLNDRMSGSTFVDRWQFGFSGAVAGIPDPNLYHLFAFGIDLAASAPTSGSPPSFLTTANADPIHFVPPAIVDAASFNVSRSAYVYVFGAGNQGNVNFTLDSVTVTPVPLPASAWLLVFACLTLSALHPTPRQRSR